MTSVQYAIDLLTDVLTVRKRNIRIAETEGYISRVPPGFQEQTEQVQNALTLLQSFSFHDTESTCGYCGKEYGVTVEELLKQHEEK